MKHTFFAEPMDGHCIAGPVSAGIVPGMFCLQRSATTAVRILKRFLTDSFVGIWDLLFENYTHLHLKLSAQASKHSYFPAVA